VYDQAPVPAFQAQVLDVRAGGLGHAQPVERQQGDQRVLGGRARATVTRRLCTIAGFS